MNKKILIIESATKPLKLVESQNEKNECYLEGILSEFNILNKNKRIYQWNEFKPHFEYLQERCKSKTLVGNLDHPISDDAAAMMEPRFSDASHIIESLEYNPEKNHIYGKIKVLDTPSGKALRALVDGGVQVSISSRAIGSVNEDNTVAIQQVATWDVVVNPGMPNAKLKKINESLGFALNENLSIFELKNEEETVPAALITENKTPVEKTKSEPVNININQPADLSGIIKDFDNLKTFITETLLYLNDKIDDMENQKQTEIQEPVKEDKKPEDVVSENNDEKPETAIDSNMTVSDLVEKVQNLEKSLTRLTSHIEENVEPVITGIEKHLDVNIDPIINRIEESVENMETHLNQNVDPTILTVKEHFETNIDPTILEIKQFNEDLNKHLTENVDPTINNISKTIKNIVKYIDYIAENVTNVEDGVAILNENGVKVQTVNENQTLNESTTNVKTIDAKIDELLEAAKVKKEDITVNESAKYYLSLLPEDKKNEFLILSTTDKQKIVAGLMENKPYTGNQVVQIWESVLQPVDINKVEIDDLVKHIPNMFINKWNSLDESIKTKILENRKYYILNNGAAKQNFWLNQSIFKETGFQYTQNMNENVTPTITNNQNPIVDPYMQMVIQNYQNRF